MYVPQHYKQTNLSEIKNFLVHNSFGILVNQLDGKPWATHIPLELDVDINGKDVLVGHIAKANPQWSGFQNDQQVLCIFNGPHSYISSSWYKQEEVPTWNYIAVHVYGTIKILDEAAVLASMHKLVDKYEINSTHPISINDMSATTMRQLKGVIGFQISFDEIHAAYKLSQTRTEDHPVIVSNLEASNDHGAHAIAEAVKNFKI